MKETLELLRRQSVILVDIFATSFLFIFLTFLVLFVRYVSSFQTNGP